MADRPLELDVDWMLTRLLDRAPAHAADIVDALAGPRQAAVLDLSDFDHVADADLLVRLLRGAAAERATGINILLHGPPGTGKTELARTLAAAAGLALHAVGEADADGEEPERWERVNALRLAQRLLAGRGGAALLFDEMEDLIGDARPSGTDWFERRPGSKVFVNRQLETNPVPVIWTTNVIGNIDAAILRRMSFVLRLFGTPAPVSLAEVQGLTPGDFAVVARQLRWTGAASPAELVERLRIEAACKPGGGGRIGF